MRPLLAVLAVLSILALPAEAQEPPAPDGDCLRAVAGLDLQTATVPQLQAAMADGRLSSATLVDAYRARIARFDGLTNAVRALDPTARAQAERLDAERARGEVRGPLHGIPVLLKDNVASTGLPLTAGSIALEGVEPSRDATLVARLREAGAVVLGKANLSEFANWVALGMPNGFSSLGGQVRNAIHGGDPSGSSAGSGVAASMAYAAVTIGTETSGSILSPSIANSVVGIKPSMGLVSRAGILPLAPSFDVAGPMTRNVTDAALVLDAIDGRDPRDPATGAAPAIEPAAQVGRERLDGVRLAYDKRTRDGLGAQRRALFDQALAQLRALGATVVEVNALAAQPVGLAEIGLIPNEFKASLNAFLAEELPGAKHKTLSAIVAHAKANPQAYRYGQNLLEASDATPGRGELYPAGGIGVRQAAAAAIEAALLEADADAIVGPGNAHANVGAAAGFPTVVVPQGALSEGLAPQGLAFLGRPYAEGSLVGFAAAYERAAAGRVVPTEVNPDLAC